MHGKKSYGIAVFTMIFVVLLIGNAFNIEDYDGVSYRNHTDVAFSYPSGENGTYWDNTSTTNIMISSDGWLMADLNDYARWESEPLRVNDNRKIIYEADVANSEDIGITVQSSDYEDFREVKDTQKTDVKDGFNEIDLNLDRGEYTRMIIEFDKAADASDAVNSLTLTGVRSDVKTGFTDVLGLGLFLILFWYGVKVFGLALGWW